MSSADVSSTEVRAEIQLWLLCCERTLKQFRRPSFPFDEEQTEGAFTAFVGVAAKELGGSWRRPGAGVEQGDADLSPGKRAVENRKISHDDGQKAEPGAGFEDDEFTRPGAVRSYVSQTEGEDGGAAHIEV
jgi:hypothetical protein